jgi:DMSO/TMAO reductase YedYZ molybdopterin-dependent catalytic subunit
MKLTIRWRRFVSRTLVLTVTILLCLPSIDRARAQNKTADAAGASIQVADFLDLRGDLPNPRRIDGSELRQLPRSETRTINPHDPGKEIVYSGSSLAEVLKAAGLHLDSGMTGVREAVTMSVIVKGIDGYRAVFALAELNPELTDRVILLADTKDGQPLPPREGPFRIIVPGEKSPGRWVRQVQTIIVRKN